MCQRHCVERFLDRRDWCNGCVMATQDDFDRTIGTVPVIDLEQLPDAWDLIGQWLNFHCVGRIR